MQPKIVESVLYNHEEGPTMRKMKTVTRNDISLYQKILESVLYNHEEAPVKRKRKTLYLRLIES